MEYGNTLLAACAPLILASCAAPATERLSNVAVAPPNCTQIAASRAAAEADRKEALEEQASSWKVLIPLVAATKLAQGTADLASAEQRIAALDAKAARLGCAGTKG